VTTFQFVSAVYGSVIFVLTLRNSEDNLNYINVYDFTSEICKSSLFTSLPWAQKADPSFTKDFCIMAAVKLHPEEKILLYKCVENPAITIIDFGSFIEGKDLHIQLFT
jgi:hypothetical protein